MANVILINFNLLEFEPLAEYHALHAYVGVCRKALYSQEATLERELDPLRRIRDAYPKRIITRTGCETTDWDGIKVIDLARWLMGESDELTF